MKATHGHRRKHAGTGKHLGTGKHRPMSAAREAAAKKWAAAGGHAAHLHAVAKHAGHPQPAKWSPTTDVACCAVEAMAASLRMAGHVVTDVEVLDLYWRITEDPDAGITLPDAFTAAADYGLAGVRLLDAQPAQQLGDGVVLGVDLAERHAMTVDGHGVWTWGAWHQAGCGLFAAADEAWELTWQ
jgi:hypothetical protein